MTLCEVWLHPDAGANIARLLAVNSESNVSIRRIRLCFPMVETSCDWSKP